MKGTRGVSCRIFKLSVFKGVIRAIIIVDFDKAGSTLKGGLKASGSLISANRCEVSDQKLSF